MFDSLDEARREVGAYVTGPLLERFLTAFAPAIVFEPAEPAGPGQTRFGGAPDLAPGTAWPRPPAPDDPEAVARRGNDEAGAMMRAHFALALPYTFVAQVDLAEAAQLGSVAADLPPDGRLLFFHDLTAGPWDPGPRAARVIWDTGPRDRLAPAPVPDDLAAAIAREHAEAAAIRARYANPEPAAEEGTNFGAPARPMRLRPVMRLPQAAALEMAVLPELDAVYRGGSDTPGDEALREAYDALLAFCDDAEDAPELLQQLLGSPRPVQDDPRLDAAVVTRFGGPWLSREEWRAHRPVIEADARDWRLLLQIDLSDWMRAEFVEGMVYFLIRADDLASRRFEGVVAIYQQT